MVLCGRHFLLPTSHLHSTSDKNNLNLPPKRFQNKYLKPEYCVEFAGPAQLRTRRPTPLRLCLNLEIFRIFQYYFNVIRKRSKQLSTFSNEKCPRARDMFSVPRRFRHNLWGLDFQNISEFRNFRNNILMKHATSMVCCPKIQNGGCGFVHTVLHALE